MRERAKAICVEFSIMGFAGEGMGEPFPGYLLKLKGFVKDYVFGIGLV